MAVVQYKNFAYLKGPKGDRGVKGDSGDRGPRGDQGPTGLTGPIGNINYSEIRSLFTGASPITYNNATGVIGFNSTGFATETYVNNIVNNLVGNAPQALNTLNELASALNNDANFASSVITTLNGKLALAGGVMTGALTLNADPTTNLQAATKQYVDSAVSSFATSLSELSDVAMTGNVVAGQVLKFNGTTWTNDTDNSGIGSVSWNSITGKPVFATVSTTGNYNDLTNKPTIPSFNQNLNTTNNVTFNSVTATSIDVENLEFTGTGPIVISSGNDLKFTSAGDITFNGSKLSTVAISGSYTDLTNKPTLFDGAYSSLSGKPSLATVATSGLSGDLTWNVYPTEIGLPDATTKHGMFAHVHETGHGYMAHSGSWVKLANYSDIPVGINQLADVDTITRIPVVGEALVWDGSNWVPGASVTAVLADASLDGGGY
jgi:hypothetical protein